MKLKKQENCTLMLLMVRRLVILTDCLIIIFSVNTFILSFIIIFLSLVSHCSTPASITTTPFIIEWPIRRPLQVAAEFLLSVGTGSNGAFGSFILNCNLFIELLRDNIPFVVCLRDIPTIGETNSHRRIHTIKVYCHMLRLCRCIRSW